VEADVSSAVARSHLAPLPPEVLAELLSGAVRERVPAGALTHRQGEPAPHLELVLSGLVRVFVTAPDGRTMTVRYCRPGALIGAVSLFSPGFLMPATTQALVPAEVLKLAPAVARRAAARDVRVAGAFLRELSERVLSFVHEIPDSAFATVRQRVARHLLDLASEHAAQAAGPPLAVRVSQRELAEAVGTVREVVVRIMRELRADGVVRTGRDEIVIVDPTRLIQDQGWNQGS
jgi:CRP/FNR family transcriptional regulator, cyclic AMP receptor protein